MESRHQAHCAGEPLNTKADYVIPGLLAERDDEFARTTIINNWPHLKSSWAYPHLLLYLATKETLELFFDFFQENTDKRKIFEIMGSSFGFRVEGRSGIKRTEQLIALEPYLEYFDDYLISALWEECTEKGFLPWRKNHLDPLISNDHHLYVYIDEEAAFLKIDNELNSGQRIHWTAYSWSDSRFGNKEKQTSRIAFAKRYVDSRQNQKSAIFFSEFVKIVGLRKDLDILAEYNASGILTQAEFDDASFSVRQRSLK